MPVFNFTVNCPASPTPTPTPSPTPLPWCCRIYSVTNNTSNTCTINYTTCNNTTTSTSAGPFATVFLGCVREGTITSACSITINTIGACNTPNNTCAQTPTPTPTPSPTPSLPPTPTPRPTYTVTVYAKLRSIPNDVRPPGAGAETAARAYYNFGEDGLGDTLIGGNITSTSCNLLGTISNVPEGTLVGIGMKSWSYNTPIYFDAVFGTTSCPPGTDSPAYCGTSISRGGGIYFLVTSNITVALTAATLSATVEEWTNKANPFTKKTIVRRKILRSLYYCDGSMPVYYYFNSVSQTT